MAVANMAIEFEKQDLSLNSQSQLSDATMVTQGDGEPESKEGSTRVTKFSRYFQVDVTTRNADVLLLTCCIISGLTDSAIYDGMPAYILPKWIVHRRSELKSS